MINKAEDVWKFVVKGGEDDCWLWKGCLSRKGYGAFHFQRKVVRAHRHIYKMLFGISSEQEKFVVCHTCDTPACCNPKHLKLVTNQENLAQSRGKRAAKGLQKGERNGRAILNKQDTLHIRAIFRALKPGTSIKRAARIIGKVFGVNKSTICHVYYNRTW